MQKRILNVKTEFPRPRIYPVTIDIGQIAAEGGASFVCLITKNTKKNAAHFYHYVVPYHGQGFALCYFTDPLLLKSVGRSPARRAPRSGKMRSIFLWKK